MNWNILIIKEKKKNVSSGERKQKPKSQKEKFLIKNKPSAILEYYTIFCKSQEY